MGNRRQFIQQLSGAAVLTALPAAMTKTALAQENEPLVVDFRTPVDRFRALQGVNKGPLGAGGLVDVIAQHRELGVPLTRTHDCHWPNADVVDMHVVFPDAKADPTRAENYDFAMTDEYLAAIRETGAEILYRLGETIEHTTIKRFVHPPKDPAHWAEVAKGIIRHYNEGWANGFQYGIKRWEIWNEPETRPGQWTGTDEQFFEFYKVVSRSLKAAFPQLMIGGPGIGITGDLQGDTLKPSTILSGFLESCRRDKLPLDFLSWHCYSAHNNPREPIIRAHNVRRLLNTYGFDKAESYLDEWRCIPDYNWGPVSRNTDPLVRQKWYERMVGPESAAYNAAVLLGLQDAPVEGATYFHGEQGGWGLFDESGVPYKNYYGLLSFRRLLDTPERAQIAGTLLNGLAVGAGRDKTGKTAQILLVNYSADALPVQLKLEGLPWPQTTIRDVLMVDARHNLTPLNSVPTLGEWNRLPFTLQDASIALIRLNIAA